MRPPDPAAATSAGFGAQIAQAVGALRAGALVAFPTETVYGLGADARSEQAVARLFALKGRPPQHPVIVHLAGVEQLADWALAPSALAYRLAERFWPGPLTLILRRRPEVLDAVTGGQETVGLRVPAHPLAGALLRAFGGGLAAPSANRFGRVSPTRAAHVRAEFGPELTVLDGGPCAVGLESTILDLSGGAPRLLRPGGVPLAALEAVAGASIDVLKRGGPRAPGSLPSHYAPATDTVLTGELEVYLKANPTLGCAVLARRARPAWFQGRAWASLPDDPAAYAQGLYAALRELDALGAAQLVVEAVPEVPAWLAVRDRLARASRPVPATPATAVTVAQR